MLLPTDMALHKKSRTFEITLSNDEHFVFSYEFLRVFSPSAEVTGHTPDQAVMQVGKRDVDIQGAEPVGNYALRFIFDDGHDSGIYSWDYFSELGQNQEALWQGYLNQLAEAGASRDPKDPANAKFAPKPKTSGCPSHKH